MAVKTSCEQVKQDVIVTVTAIGDYVRVHAKFPNSGYSWSLGDFKQDANGSLYFQRAGGISENVAYPKVMLDGDRVKVI